MIGHLGFPQSSFAPLHRRHIHAGGFSTTSIDLATSSSTPVTAAGITFESQVTLRGIESGPSRLTLNKAVSTCHLKYILPVVAPMPRFAHLSDIHIGAFRQPELRELVLTAFEAAVDICIRAKVDFIILAGDIFDSNIPDLSSVRRAAEKMKQAVDAGIRVYAIYGSHDFSPNYSSIVDVLQGAGLFTKVERMAHKEGRVLLSFVQDPSGPKLCGISGRKLSIDLDEYANLDNASLEAEPGFKVFVFHGAIEELRPSSLEQMEAVSYKALPSGFKYYAGGHLHYRGVHSFPAHPNIAYPGPLFATDYPELLQIARGGTRGFYIVDFGDDVDKVQFVPVTVCEIVEVYYSAEGKTSGEAASDLAKLATRSDLRDKVVLLTVEGQLSDGKTSDIDFNAVRRRLLASGPKVVLSNYSHFTSLAMARPEGPARPVWVTERELFAKEIGRVKSEVPKLRGDEGVTMALDLLKVLKTGRKENENKGEFEDRTTKAGFDVLGLEES
jgi:DNA repair protein SbcD/Mre11